MAKFSRQKSPVRRHSPVSTTGRIGSAPDIRTHQGGAGWSRDPKSDLFLLGVTNMVSEDTFYEAATNRDDRFAALVQQVTVEDPAWVGRFVRFLRETANMRSASVVAAAEHVLARRGSKISSGSNLNVPTVRSVVDSVLLRPDEPGEFVGYWLQRHGRTFPGGVQRGVADAVRRLYTEKNALKYDGTSRGVRMGDVIELIHPEPKDHQQNELFKWLLERRHNRLESHVDLDMLPMILNRMMVEGMPVAQRREYLEENLVGVLLAQAGMTWEALAGWLQGPMDRRAWEVMIPNMGYMALLRNLRNFDRAGVRDDVAETVAARLGDPAEVARSRQFPMRFLSAYKAAPSLRWSYALEKALNASLANVPVLPGRTLILVDQSQSMFAPLSGRSDLTRAEAAAVFGTALALRAERPTLVQFGTTSSEIRVRPGDSVLPIVVGQFHDLGGTNTAEAVDAHYKGHDRVVVVTDEQADGRALYGRLFGSQTRSDVYASIPAKVPVYTFNLAGYAPASAPSGDSNRVTIGGLTDAGFRVIPLIEKGRDAAWDDLFSPVSTGNSSSFSESDIE